VSLLSIEGLSCKYGRKTVLKDINLEVKSGDFLGVLGPNGSGKTTLLKCISGVLKPASGSVLMEGRELSHLSYKEIAQKIAVVPQGIEAGFEFSVREFVMMGRTPYLKPFRGETAYDISVVRKAMEFTGVLPLSERNFRELSGGERQRVVIAQALAQEPDLLLLDEPSSYLDISREIEVFNLIRELNRKRNITVIVVLHDLNLASRYCSSLAILRNGTVFGFGTPGKILTPENIRKVYHTEVEILHSRSGEYIVPLSGNGDHGVIGCNE